MTKQTKSPQLTLNVANDWMSHPWVERLMSNRQLVLWGVCILFASLIVAYRILSISNLNTEGDFFRAQALFTHVQENDNEEGNNEADIKELQGIMQRHPELQAKYDGPLAQTSLIEGNIPQAKAFADPIFQRTKPDHLALYQDYSQTSLLIGEGKYQEALQKTDQLKVKLEGETVPMQNSALYAFNLVRRALLLQELGQSDAEVQAWKELQTLMAASQPGYNIDELFTTGEASLSQYINERMNTLVK